MRRLAYRYHLKSITRVAVPIIVVGNIDVGGTGKTPLVIWLANFLKSQGYTPGIITRGYKAKIKDEPILVTAKSSVKMVGDEALLLFTHCSSPIMVHPKRALAAQHLLAQTDCNVLISDDGLQHYALGRNIEIAVVDGKRQFGNGFCLPAGPLREPIRRLEEVDFVIINGGLSKQTNNMFLSPQSFYKLLEPRKIIPLQELKGKKVHAVAGIGNPKRFFYTLEQLGIKVIPHAFPDHYSFEADDLNFKDEYPIVMTEKDAVKCNRFKRTNIFVLQVAAELYPNFGTRLLSKLREKAENN